MSGAFMYEDVVADVSKLKPILSREVASAEAALGMSFPDGYREFVLKFGQGVLGGNFIRIYPPARIARDLDGWRRRIEEYWFWDRGATVAPKAKVLNGVILGDTLNGDELFFHQLAPNVIFVLPRDSEEIFVAGEGLPAAIAWICTSGVLTERFDERNFEPFE
jgi:hypothetical protein